MTTEDRPELLKKNEVYLQKQGKKYKSKELKKLEEINRSNAEMLDDADWTRNRKQMRNTQHQLDMQMTY